MGTGRLRDDPISRSAHLTPLGAGGQPKEVATADAQDRRVIRVNYRQNCSAPRCSNSSRQTVLKSCRRSIVPLFTMSRSSTKFLSGSIYVSRIFLEIRSALATTASEDNTRISLSFA